MMKQEFENKIGRNISEENWQVVNTVYTFHPSIDDVGGKDQLSNLYLVFGMTIIFDMLPRAERQSVLETERIAAKRKLAEIEERIAGLNRS